MTRRLPDPHELLTGRATADAATVCALIRDVNPTGRGCSRAETARRYALKSRLQSLLVRAHGEVLVVARDERHPDEAVVALRTLAGADGGHARLDALDDDARAWVRRRLDEGAPEGPAVRPAAAMRRARGLATRKGDTPAPLAEARDAVDEYDFERARELLEPLACEEGPDANAAAGLLVDLLVNQLALYDVALALAAEWSGPVRADPAIRAALARADAESGDDAAAAAWIEGADERAALDVCRELAERACAARRLDLAESWLVRIKSAAPTFVGLPGLIASVAALRRNLAEPLERELRAHLESDDLLSAESTARALRAIEPSHGLLRELSDGVVRRRREVAAAEAIARAEVLASTQRLREALEALGMLELQGVSDPIRARVTTLRRDFEAEAQKAAQRVAARSVIDALASGRRAIAFTEYAGLSEPARALVRAADARAELGWLDELRSWARPAEVVAAVVALGIARVDLAREQPAQLLATLEPHRKLLERLAVGAELLGELRRRVREEARATAQQRLARATSALDEGRLAEARAEIAATLGDRELVDGELRDAAKRALSAVEMRERSLANHGAIEAAFGLVDPVAARAALVALLARLNVDDEQAACASALREVEARVVAAYRIESATGPGPDGELWPFLTEASSAEAPAFVASPDGALAFLATSFADWLFVHAVDLRAGAVVARASLRLPSAIGTIRQQVLVDGVLWVAGTTGAVLGLRVEAREASHARFDVLPIAWRGATHAPGEIVDGVQLAGRGSKLWLEVRRGDDTRTTVTDLPSGERREVGALSPIGVLDDRERPAIVCNCFRDRSVNLCSPTGGVLRKLAEPGDEGLVVASAAADPRGGEGLALLVYEPETDRDAELWLGTGASPDPTASRRPIPGLDPRRIHVLVSMASTRSFAVLASPGEQSEWHHSLDGAEFTLQPVSLDSVVVQDLGARHAWALTSHARGIACHPLDVGLPRELGALTGATRAAARRFTWAAPRPMMRCKWVRGPVRAHALALTAERSSRRADRSLSAFRKLASLAPTDGEHAAAVLSAADDALPTASLDELALDLASRHLGSPVVRLFEAEAHLGARRFAEARAAIEAAAHATAEAEPEEQQHRLHLLAILELQVGDVGAASRAIRDAQSLEGECALDGLAALIAGLEGASASPSDDERSALSTLLQLVRAADVRLGAGDAKGAVDILEVDIVSFAEELQTRARLAEAWLAINAIDALTRIRKRVALSSFLAGMAERPEFQRRLPLGAAGWDDTRLDEVARHARAWLDEPRSAEQ